MLQRPVAGKMTAGPSLILLERVFYLFSLRAWPIAEASAAIADPMCVLLALG